MKLKLKQIENILVLIFFLVLPLQKHHIFFKYGYEFGDFSAVSIYVSDLSVLSLIILAFFRKRFLKELSKNRIFLILAVFLAFEAFFLPHETYPAFFKDKMAELALLFAYFAFSEVSYATIARSITISGLFQALLAIAQFIKQGSLGLHFLGEQVLSIKISGVAKIQTTVGTFIRPYGTLAHPNQLAAFLLVACATTLILVFQSEKSKTRLFYMVSLFLLVLGEILTFSRAGWLATAISLTLILLLSRGTLISKIAYKRAVLTLILAMAFGALASFPYINSRLTVTDQSSMSHVYYDLAGLKSFSMHPIFGSGLGELLPAVSKIESYTYLWQIQPPHNYFIDVACETGIIGLAVFIYIFWVLGSKLWKKLKIGESEEIIFKIFLFAVFAGILLLMQFDHYFYTLQQTQLLLWAFLGIIYRTVYRETRAYS